MGGVASKLVRRLKMLAYQVNARRLWRRYVFGLALILGLLTASHLATLSALDGAKEHVRAVAESARQLETTQQIMFLAERASSERTGSYGAMLGRLVDDLAATHDKLLSGALSPRLDRLYFEGLHGPALDPILRRFIHDARIVASAQGELDAARAAFKRMSTVGFGVLPRTQQEALELYQSETTVFADHIGFLLSVAFLAALAVLGLEAVFIFLPAHLSARGALDRLEKQASSLQRAQRNLHAQNQELERLRRAAEHDAGHDALTGLANRRGFEVEAERRSARATSRGLAALHIDLDRFKEINDTLGHAAGDFILAHVAEVLRELTGPEDFIARIGGDEFVILTEARCGDGCCDRSELQALAGRVIDRLGQPISFEGEHCQFGASVGIDIGIACSETGELDPQRLLANADLALYRAKESGRGRYEFFSEELRRKVEESKTLSDDMLLGLQRGEFFPVFQPQFDARTGALSGVEALARWRHPVKGVLSPGTFLPIAERLGVAPAIDTVVLTQALQHLADWDRDDLGVPRLAVNVSSRRLRDRDLVASLVELRIPRGRLCFEVLETIFADTVDDELRHTLDQLTEAGVDIEVDDFGTGHASLMSLIALAPKRLKVARELIAPLPDCERHAGLVRLVTEIAASLNIGVTAEGVETPGQRDALRALGCDRFQGFLFARPMTAADLREALERGALKAG